MTNVYTLKDINNKSNCSFRGVGQRLGGAYEQEFKEKLYSALKSKAEINDLSEKLIDKYNEREKEFENKASQLIASTTKVRSQLISERKSHLESQRELEAKYTAEIKSLKSNIKTLKREATLTQKASSADKVQILSLETKVRELEEANRSLRDQLASKKNNEVDTPSPPMNDSSQLDPEGTLSTFNPSSQIISVGGAEAVSLLYLLQLYASWSGNGGIHEKKVTNFSPTKII
ncbi:hypothetical protein GLOIN_2v1777817 [Rhizophagus clarus]|uniref:Uncharacterized protein n=1 Tax=Rhizophagus clarus TaxID=94130 RepID=A0A8H3QNP9_9GLOM|nr:hypothetical protein GLOIN_2v1777817 [Rhizophagus clarus]